MGSLNHIHSMLWNSPRRQYISVFALFFTSRVVFSWLLGFDHYSYATDAYRIEQAVDMMLYGQFDLDIGRFIVAPFYPFFWLLHKFVFGQFWPMAMGISQWLIMAVGACFFYALALRLFNSKVATVATLLYALFPTMWVWSTSFSSESIFTTFFIITFYFLVDGVVCRKKSSLIWSAVFFSLSFLLKSHALLFAPGIVWYFFQVSSSVKKALATSFLYASVCVVFTLPYGLYTYKKHQVYTLAGNGALFHFYTGHSWFGYRTIVDVPPQESTDFLALKQMDFAAFNGPKHDSLMQLPVRERQSAFGKWGWQWVKENPWCAVELSAYNACFFLLPGVSFRHYPWHIWLFLFVLSVPVYFGAYAALKQVFLKPKSVHAFFAILFVGMFIFSVVFYVQNRFRTLTIEPFYLLYASAWWLNRGGSFRLSE
jgi:4-amino-4-deoxy-L-arabinose transferase-like glycosyltransferase